MKYGYDEELEQAADELIRASLSKDGAPPVSYSYIKARMNSAHTVKGAKGSRSWAAGTYLQRLTPEHVRLLDRRHSDLYRWLASEKAGTVGLRWQGPTAFDDGLRS